MSANSAMKRSARYCAKHTGRYRRRRAPADAQAGVRRICERRNTIGSRWPRVPRGAPQSGWCAVVRGDRRAGHVGDVEVDVRAGCVPGQATPSRARLAGDDAGNAFVGLLLPAGCFRADDLDSTRGCTATRSLQVTTAAS